MSTSLRLSSYSESDNGKTQNAVYTGSHSTPGRAGTTLEFKVSLERSYGGLWEAAVVFEGCEAESPREVLKRLADWCNRAGASLAEADNDEWAERSLPLGRTRF
jgi:hypothetical protein